MKLINIINEMDEKKKCASGSICPFCNTKIEHGKLVAHIKSDHKDLIEYNKK